MAFDDKVLVNKFFGSVMVLASGAAAGQLIVMAFTPVLTRMYSPESFGLLATYSALLGLLCVISSLRYEIAIPLTDTDEIAASVLVLSAALVFVVSFCVGIILFFLKEDIGEWLNSPELSQYLWLVPFGMIFNGLYNSANYWAIRTKSFKSIAKTKISQSTTMVLVQLGASSFGSGALMLGHTAGLSAGTVGLWVSTIKKYTATIRGVRLQDIRQAAYVYRRFPLFSVWAGLLNSIGTQAPFILFTVFFGAAEAGLFFISNRILAAPMSVIGNAIGHSFLAGAAEAQRTGTLEKKARNIVYKLFFVIIGPALLIAVSGREIFSLVLGENWTEAGLMAQWLTPMIIAQFITSPIGQLLAVKDRQAVGAVLQALLTSLRISSIVIGQLYFDVVITVALYSLASSVGYILFLYFSLKCKARQ